MRFPSVIVLLFFVTPAMASEQVVSGGDVAALIKAIDAANSDRGSSEILVSGVFRFDSDTRLPPIRASVALRGTGAATTRFEGIDGGPDQLIRVENEGKLSIEDAKFSGFSLTNPLFEPGPFGPWIDNLGELIIERTALESISGTNSGSVGHGVGKLRGHVAIQNKGLLQLNGVAFLDVGVNDLPGGLLINLGTANLTNVQIAHFHLRLAGSTILNRDGEMRLLNVTMSGGHVFPNQPLVGIRNLGSFGKISMGNSVVTAFSFNCNRRVTSLGHNISSDTTCRLEQKSDISDAAAALIPLGFRRNNQLTIPVLEPSASSPAVDSADPALCPGRDVVGVFRGLDGNQDGMGGCDRGAVERYPRLLSQGGANGLFFDPDNDGHFVSVLENDHNTLLTWNTFDRSGASAWVFGIGQLVSGVSLVADAYISRDGVLSEGGPPMGANVVHWGTLELELDDCNSGRFFYTSDDPAFGHGQFPIKRLARVKQLGCRDR